MEQKMTTIDVEVPYKGAGGVIQQHAVRFDVYQIEEGYSLRPCLNPSELRLANLPEELNFLMQSGKPVSLRGPKDGNFHVIQDAVAVLKAKNALI